MIGREISEDKIHDLATEFMSDKTVGLLVLHKNKSESLGTGTLVRQGENYGIITCAHVANLVKRHNEVGVVYFNSREGDKQFSRVTTSDCGFTTLGPGSLDDEGPDLAFISLPPNIASALQAKLTFVDWEYEVEKAVRAEPEGVKRISYLAGLLAVQDSDVALHETVNAKIYLHRAAIHAGTVEDGPQQSGFDYFDFNIPIDSLVSRPKNFGATSGGPVWRFFFKTGENGLFALVERRFLGVAFYEIDGANPKIRCHGPHSLHNVLRGKVIHG